jgi:hypothetical protein
MNAAEIVRAGRLPLPEALLAYAELGLHVFPLPPKAKHWQGKDALSYLDATADTAELSRLIDGVDLADPDAWPNIGLQPGRSGLIAVDLDGPAGMDAWTQAAKDADAEPWDTLGYRTPREDGGVRLLYRMPPGVTFGKRIPVDGVELFGTVGHVVLPPSIHPNGKGFVWTTEHELTDFPPFAIALLGTTADQPHAPTAAVTSAEVEAYLDSLPLVTVPTPYGTQALAGLLDRLRQVGRGRRHGTAVHSVTRVLELAADSRLTARPALDELAATFRIVLAGERDRLPAAEFAGILRWSVPRVQRAREEAQRRAESPDAFALLVKRAADVFDGLDPDAVSFALAISATSDLDDGTPPVWGALVGPSSGGKTAMLELVRDMPNTVLVDELSVPGLLSWTKGKTPRQTGLLLRIGKLGTLLVQDFSTLLSEDGYRQREAVFAALRRVHDGHFSRSLGEREADLCWDGRVTLLTAVTHAVDSYSGHMTALGARWVYLRLASREVEGKKRMSAKSRSRSGTATALKELRTMAGELVAAGRVRLPETELSEDLGALIDEVAVVCGYGRGSVPRSGYGRREVIGMVDIEEPARAAQGLALLARAVLALGLDEQSAARLVLRSGVDSMPRSRALVLEQLSSGTVLTAAEIARATGIARTVVREVLADLRLLGLAALFKDDENREEDDRTPLRYSLGGEAGDIAHGVMQQYRDARPGRP